MVEIMISGNNSWNAFKIRLFLCIVGLKLLSEKELRNFCLDAIIIIEVIVTIVQNLWSMAEKPVKENRLC